MMKRPSPSPDSSATHQQSLQVSDKGLKASPPAAAARGAPPGGLMLHLKSAPPVPRPAAAKTEPYMRGALTVEHMLGGSPVEPVDDPPPPLVWYTPMIANNNEP